MKKETNYTTTTIPSFIYHSTFVGSDETKNRNHVEKPKDEFRLAWHWLEKQSKRDTVQTTLVFGGDFETNRNCDPVTP